MLSNMSIEALKEAIIAIAMKLTASPTLSPKWVGRPPVTTTVSLIDRQILNFKVYLWGYIPPLVYILIYIYTCIYIYIYIYTEKL